MSWLTFLNCFHALTVYFIYFPSHHTPHAWLNQLTMLTCSCLIITTCAFQNINPFQSHPRCHITWYFRQTNASIFKPSQLIVSTTLFLLSEPLLFARPCLVFLMDSEWFWPSPDFWFLLPISGSRINHTRTVSLFFIFCFPCCLQISLGFSPSHLEEPLTDLFRIPAILHPELHHSCIKINYVNCFITCVDWISGFKESQLITA